MPVKSQHGKPVRKSHSIKKAGAKKMVNRAVKMAASPVRAATKSAARASRLRVYKVGELWDDRETAFFQPYADQLGR